MKKLIAMAICLTVCFSFLPAVSCSAAAEDCILDGHRYIVKFDTNVPGMGHGAFENKKTEVVIERIGDWYYLTLSVNPSMVGEVKFLTAGDRVGETVRTDGDACRHTYTLTAKQLNETLNFTMFVKKPMKKEMEVTVDLLLQTAREEGTVDLACERPPHLVPTVQVEQGNREAEKGSIYPIPAATASLEGKPLELSVSAYYLKGAEKVQVPIENNGIRLDYVGEYHLVYSAGSDAYQTRLGKNTSSSVEIVILSKVGVTALAQAEELDGGKSVLQGLSVLADRVPEQSLVFDAIAEKLQDRSDCFDVIYVTYRTEDGKQSGLTGNVALYLRLDPELAKGKIRVYHYGEEGPLTELSFEQQDGAVRLETDLDGSFVISREGGTHRMPVYGYVLIAAGTAAVLTAAAVIPIIAVKKKKRSARS